MSRTRSSIARAIVAASLVFSGALAVHVPGEAHKAITSKYSFNEDLFPLFREHCGRCHVDGGVAPMSLLTHEDAAPWAESLRLEFLSEEPPPPWHPMRLSARELDMVLVWANGGTPRGDATKAPPPVPLVNEWAVGPPDIALPVAPFTLDGPVNEATHEVTLPLTPAAGQTIGAVDVLPGNPAIVREVTLAIKATDGVLKPLATWMPGRTSAVALAAPATVPPGATLVATFSYRRTWKYEGQALTDGSIIGLYAPRPASQQGTRAPGAAPRPRR